MEKAKQLVMDELAVKLNGRSNSPGCKITKFANIQLSARSPPPVKSESKSKPIVIIGGGEIPIASPETNTVTPQKHHLASASASATPPYLAVSPPSAATDNTNETNNTNMNPNAMTPGFHTPSAKMLSMPSDQSFVSEGGNDDDDSTIVVRYDQASSQSSPPHSTAAAIAASPSSSSPPSLLTPTTSTQLAVSPGALHIATTASAASPSRSISTPSKTRPSVSTPRSSSKSHHRRRSSSSSTRSAMTPSKQHKAFLRSINHDIDDLRKILSSKTQLHWQDRITALKKLSSMCHDINIQARLTEAELAFVFQCLVEPMSMQLTELRSLVIKQACETITVLVHRLGDEFSIFAPVMTPLCRLTRNTKSAMYAPADACLRAIVEEAHSSAILHYIFEALKSNGKSSQLEEKCAQYLIIVLAKWPKQLLTPFGLTIRQYLKDLLNNAHADVRLAARKAFFCYWKRWNRHAAELFHDLSTQVQDLIYEEFPELDFTHAQEAGDASVERLARVSLDCFAASPSSSSSSSSSSFSSAASPSSLSRRSSAGSDSLKRNKHLRSKTTTTPSLQRHRSPATPKARSASKSKRVRHRGAITSLPSPSVSASVTPRSASTGVASSPSVAAAAVPSLLSPSKRKKARAPPVRRSPKQNRNLRNDENFQKFRKAMYKKNKGQANGDDVEIYVSPSPSPPVSKAESPLLSPSSSPSPNLPQPAVSSLAVESSPASSSSPSSSPALKVPSLQRGVQMSEIAAITVSSEGDDADERTIITIKNARSTDANNIAVPEQAETKAAEKSGEEEPAPTLQSSAPSNAMRPVLQRKESFLSTGAVANSWHAGLRSSVTLKKLAAEPVTSAVYKLAVPVEEAEEEDDRYHSRRLPPVPKFPVSPRVSPKRLSLGGDGGLTTSPKKSSPERAAWRHTLRKGECPYEELSTQEAQRLVNEVQDQEEEVYADGDLNGINNHSPQKVKGRVEVDGESAHYMNPTEASIVKSRKLKQPKRINYVGPSESDVEHRLRVEKRREFMEKKRQAVEGAQIAQLEQDLKLARAETYHALREAQEAREIKISYQALAGEKAAQDSAFKLMHKRVDLLTKANKELSMKVAISRNRVKGPKRIDQLRAEHKKEIEYEREQTRKKCAVEYDKLKQKLNNVTMEKRGLLSRMNKLTARSNAIDERAEKVKTRETTLDDTVSALEEQLAATEEERKRLDVANDNLTHRNNSLQGQIDEMQDQINKLIIDGEDMERGKDAIRKLELQEAHKEELREEIKTAYTALQSVQSSNTRLTTQVERLQDELESAKLQLQLMESDKASRDSIASVLHKQQRDDLHDEIKSQAQKQQDKISLLNEKTDMLESNLEAEKAISKQYEDAMEAARKRRKDVESERDLLREQIEEKAEALSHLRQEYNALSQDFEDYKARAAEVEKERASVSAVPTLDAMAKEAEGGRTKDEGKEKEVKEAPLQSENTDDAHGNRKSVAGTAADTANLCDVSITVQMDEEEIQALQEQIQQLKLKHEDIMQSETNKYVNVKTELDELRADHSRLQAIRETEKSEYLEARSERDVLQEQFSEMKEAHESMLGKYEALRSEYDALSETHVQELSNTTSDDKRLRKEAESDLERARVQRGNLEQDLKDVRAENQRMTDDVVDLREQCEALQVQLAGKETETSMLQQERSEMKTKFIALTEKVDSLSSAQAAAQESVALKREQEQRERDLRREQEYQKQKEAQREQERELALQRERDQMKEDELKKEQNRLMERGVGQLRKEAELREQKLEAEIALLRQQAAQEEMKHQQTQYLQEQQQQHRILEQHQAQNVAAQSLYAARPIMDRDLQHGSPPSKRGLSHSLSLSPSHSFVHDGAGIGSGNNENLNYPGLRQHISVYLSNQPQSPQAIRAAINALRQEKIANRRSLSPVALQLISEIENVLRELVILGTKLNTRLQTIKSLPDTAAPAAASMSDRQTDKQLMAYSSVVQYKKKLSTQVSVLRNTYSSTQQKIAHSWHKLVVELRMDQANQLRQPTHASLHMHAVGSGAGAGMNASAHNIHNLSTATMSLASPASTHHHSHLTMNPPSSSSFAAVNEQAMRERARMKLRAELGAHITSSANHAAINTPTGGLGSSSMLAMLNESHARQALGSRPVPASVLSSSASSSFASPRAGTAQQESAYERYLRSSNPPFNLNTPTPTPTSASASASVTTPGFRAQRGSNPPLSLASADAANTAALRRLRNI